MTAALQRLFATQGGVATSSQILQHISRGEMQRYLRHGQLTKLWPNVYSQGDADAPTRLRGLDLRCGETVAACLGTAAAAYGFDTENTTDPHVLNRSATSCAAPPAFRSIGVTVHR